MESSRGCAGNKMKLINSARWCAGNKINKSGPDAFRSLIDVV